MCEAEGVDLSTLGGEGGRGQGGREGPGGGEGKGSHSVETEEARAHREQLERLKGKKKTPHVLITY